MRRIVSLTMFLGFIMMMYTGIMLFLCPQGRVAYWTGWRLLGLSKDQYAELHTVFMVVFATGGIWHIVLNWKPIVNYLRSRSKQLKIFTAEFNIALVLTVLFTVGTLAGIVPWSSYIQLENSIKDYWERRDGSPPWGHAEENTLARFTRGLVDWERLEHNRDVQLAVDEALAALRGAGLTVESEEQQLIDIAKANSTTPQALMAILREAETPLSDEEAQMTPTRVSESPFPLPYSGLGRMSLQDYCARYDLDLQVLLGLFPDGMRVDPNRTLRELAEDLDTDPEGVIEMLNQRAGPSGR
jgi:hypothetical protein